MREILKQLHKGSSGTSEQVRQRLYEALVQPTDESMAAWLERVAPGCTSRFDEDIGLERAFDSDGDEELHEELQALFDESDESLAVDEADIRSIMSD